MAITNPPIQVERTTSPALYGVPIRRMIQIGAIAVVVAVVTLVASSTHSGQGFERPHLQPASPSRDAIVQDLVDRGIVPGRTLQPATPTRDAIVQDLVDRGIVPGRTLQPATPTRDAIVQDLVDRGIVPGRTLQPATPTRDAIVQDLVDRGLVPAATMGA